MQLINKLVTGMMPVMPRAFVGRVASRYIAGEKLQDAISLTRRLNGQGAVATIDLLGEHSANAEQVKAAVTSYIDTLNAIQQERLDANVSLKPTHLGLKLGYQFCLERVTEIVSRAAELGNFVRIDMEDHTCTDDTFRLFFDLRKRFDNVGVVIQAYLRRTLNDIKPLIEARANLRLCKGIYNEPRLIAYKNRAVIIDNYALILEELLKAGCYVGIATHCEETIWHARRIIHQMGLSDDRYEFQMLLGVEPELRRILIGEGHKLRVYIPYGLEWYSYSSRRLKENPSIAGYVMRDFFGMSKLDEKG